MSNNYKFFTATFMYVFCICSQLRHIAYRQLTSWCGKKLGKRFRVVLPSCAVTLIRQTFASSGGQYVVFKL
jgi:hypothetical protein